MPDIIFETGLKRYNINGVCEVSFNPTDSNFVERIYSAFDLLDKKHENYREKVEKTADHKKIFEMSRELDAEMREVIDGIFQTPVCSAVFGSVNVYAVADGLPIWCNLMLSIMDEIDTAFSREQKATNPRIKKYTDKWNKK